MYSQSERTIVTTESNVNHLATETPNSRKAAKQELYKRAHLCRALTGNASFYSSGNGLGYSFENQVVLWFSDKRTEGKPNKRTKKSSVPEYLQQDAVDGLIALANIAERYAPYDWGVKEIAKTSRSASRALAKKGMRILINECGSFVDRFGLPHMRWDGEGPGTRKNPICPEKLAFADQNETDFASIASRYRSIVEKEENLNGKSYLKQRLKMQGLYVDGDPEQTDSLIFYDMISSFAKDFSGISDFKKAQSRLKGEKSSLINVQRKAFRHGDYDEASSISRKITRLHVDQGILTLAADNAFRKFKDEERATMSDNGIIKVDTERLYRIGLLFRDALELYAAIDGDEKAFRRVLGKTHMEVFDARLPFGVEESSNAQSALLSAEGRYTIWFESSGYDLDNPGCNLDDSSVVLNRNEYEASVFDIPLMLQRKERFDEVNENYGCGVSVHILCEPGESPEQFEALARKYLAEFLKGLTAIGAKHNYKHLFANPAIVSEKNPSITVNDFNHDLTRTLWVTMDLISKEAIPLRISRCKCCGRLMNTAKEAGNAREFCDASCRSLHRKRCNAQNKEAKTVTETALRQQFYRFEESLDAICIGMASHMLPEMQRDNSIAEPKPGTTTPRGRIWRLLANRFDI